MYDDYRPVWKTETIRRFLSEQSNAKKAPRQRKKNPNALTIEAFHASLALLAPGAPPPPGSV